MRLYFSKVLYLNLIIFSVGEHVSRKLRIFVLNCRKPIGFITCLYIYTVHFDFTISCVFPLSLLSNRPSCRLCFKNKVYWVWRDGCFRALVTLADDRGSVLSTHEVVAHNHL